MDKAILRARVVREINDIEVHTDFDDKFTLIKQLGRGSFGNVFECQSKVNSQTYAVKITEYSFNEFLYASIMASLKIGPKIEAFYKKAEKSSFILSYTKHTGYIVMEKFDADLTHYDSSYLPLIKKEVPRVLEKMTTAGIMCLDIAPRNWMIKKSTDSEPEKLVIIDFGAHMCCSMHDKCEEHTNVDFIRKNGMVDHYSMNTCMSNGKFRETSDMLALVLQCHFSYLYFMTHRQKLFPDVVEGCIKRWDDTKELITMIMIPCSTNDDYFTHNQFSTDYYMDSDALPSMKTLLNLVLQRWKEII